MTELEAKRKPVQIAFVNQSRKVKPSDFAFRVAAVNLAMIRDFAPAWKGHLPGADQEPWPCVDYKTTVGLKTRYLHPIFEMDHIGAPDAAGFHDDEAGFIYGRTLPPSDPHDATTEDHEAKEMRGDPTCDLWWRMPDGRDAAAETGDPVEGDSYPVQVSIAGETRTIYVSNFILPAWKTPGAPGPYDFMGKLKAPFTMTPGGYLIIRDPRTGETTDVFAEHADSAHLHLGRKLLAVKRADPHSRAARRLANHILKLRAADLNAP